MMSLRAKFTPKKTEVFQNSVKFRKDYFFLKSIYHIFNKTSIFFDLIFIRELRGVEELKTLLRKPLDYLVT